MYTPLRPCTPADLAAELASPTAEWTRSEGSDGPNSSSAGFRYGPLLLSRGCQVPQLDPLSVRKCLHSSPSLCRRQLLSLHVLGACDLSGRGAMAFRSRAFARTRITMLGIVLPEKLGAGGIPRPLEEVFSGTSTRLRGHELCDCYRKACCHEDELVENRFFKLDKLELSLSFISFGLNDSRWRSHGTVPLGDHHAMRHALRCAPGECGPPSTSSGNGTADRPHGRGPSSNKSFCHMRCQR